MRTSMILCLHFSFFLVFADRCPAADRVSAIFAIDANGQNLRVITELPDYPSVGSPDISPDGTRLAFDGWSKGESSGDANIFILNLKTKKIQNLGNGAMPTWSADGKYLAYSNYNPRGVFIRAVDGTATKMIDEQGWGIQWSPDGTKLSYTVRGDFVIYDILSGKKRTIQPKPDAPYRTIYWNSDWSHDSTKLAFRGVSAEGKFENSIIDISKDPAELTVCFTYENGYGNEFAWHPDGKRITTISSKNGQQIHNFPPDATTQTVAMEGQPTERNNVAICWSTDGKTLYFVSQTKNK